MSNASTAKDLLQHDLFGADPVPFEPRLPVDIAKSLGGPDMVRVSPTSWAWRPKDPDRVPKYGRMRWLPNGDGTFRPVPNDVRFVIVSREVLDEIGFRGMARSVSDTTMRRLSQAEEILMFHISPKVRMLDLDSWWKFIDDCVNNPDKWEVGSESHENYMFRNFLGRHKTTR
jgi:hypothetical protein